MSQSSVLHRKPSPRGMSLRDLCVHLLWGCRAARWLGLQQHQPGLLYVAWLGGPASATCREGRGTGVPRSTCLVGLSEN